jgi:glucose-1-phosphate adenylyltransferase
MKPIDVAASFDLPRRAVALVLAGGRGSRLKNLTDSRAKPAVYFGGKFRIVDFALSNCMNCGMRWLVVMSDFKSLIVLWYVV